MFSGFIKSTGKIKNIKKNIKNIELQILSKLKLKKKDIGSSICCSGACLTVDKIKENTIYFYISIETINRTNFKYIKSGNIVNLEQSLKFGQRNSGHFVQGHVDASCKVNKIVTLGKSWIITINLPKKYKKYVIEKGSVAINGVSLTISKILKDSFEIVVIPRSLKETNLIYLKNKDFVNVEFDVLGKYIKNFL